MATFDNTPASPNSVTTVNFTTGAAGQNTVPLSPLSNNAADSETVPVPNFTTGSANVETVPGATLTSDDADANTVTTPNFTASGATVETVPSGSFDNTLANVETVPEATLTSNNADANTVTTPNFTASGATAETVPSGSFDNTAATQIVYAGEVAPYDGGTPPDILTEVNHTVSLSSGTHYGVNCTSRAASIQVNLPDPPSAGQIVEVRDVSGQANTYNITVNPGTKPIDGSTNDIVLNRDYVVLQVVYVSSENTWKVI
tara:strand:- start:185 stop:961 length:777 start_codon:yes stop_codon:yes gene_type:complete